MKRNLKEALESAKRKLFTASTGGHVVIILGGKVADSADLKVCHKKISSVMFKQCLNTDYYQNLYKSCMIPSVLSHY